MLQVLLFDAHFSWGLALMTEEVLVIQTSTRFVIPWFVKRKKDSSNASVKEEIIYIRNQKPACLIQCLVTRMALFGWKISVPVPLPLIKTLNVMEEF